MADDLEQELRLAKAARDEWMKRWQFAEGRLVAVWDDALHSAKIRIGKHDPKCIDPCIRCWVHDELHSMLRGDVNNYIPIKERAAAEVEKLLDEADRRAQKDDNFFFDSYEAGVRDTLFLVEKMLGDHE